MAYAIPAMHLTEAGKALYAKVHNGAPLRFTRVAVGDGYITEDILDITQLVSPVDATVDTLEKQVMPDGTFRMAVRIYSADKDFYLREVGIMAYDPDDGEILYAYSNYGDNADYITTYSGSYPVTQDIDIYVDIGATENVSIDITGITNVTWDDIKDKLEQREVSSLPTTCTKYDFAEDIIYEGIERCTVEYDQENDRLEIDSASNAGNKYGMAAMDMSQQLSGTDNASIEFDAYIPSGSRWYVSLVNLSVRPGECHRMTYDRTGVAICFGTKDGNNFLLNGDIDYNVPLDTWLRFSAVFNNKLKTVTYEIKNKDTGISYISDELDYLDYTCAEITAIEVYTWSQSNLKIANTLSVTLGDTPSNNIRYIVEENGYRNEYIYINGTPVRIGSTAVTEIPELSEKAHTHENKTVLDGVSSEKVSNWDAAYSQRHTHSNKSVLDGISSSDISNWDGKANTNSPTFSGTPKAPTPDTSDNSTRLATTAFVQELIEQVKQQIANARFGDEINSLTIVIYKITNNGHSEYPYYRYRWVSCTTVNNGTLTNSDSSYVRYGNGQQIMSGSIIGYNPNQLIVTPVTEIVIDNCLYIGSSQSAYVSQSLDTIPWADASGEVEEGSYASYQKATITLQET